MNRALLCALILAGLLPATLVAAAADPNCVRVVYDPALLPAEIDPNVVEGLLLLPLPGDVHTFELPAGKFNRPWARACDPNGDPFTIECTASSLADRVTIHHDPNAGLWSWSARLDPGPQAVTFRVTDAPRDAAPLSQTYTTCFLVARPPNEAPVLQ